MSNSVVVGWIRSPEGQAAVEAAVEETRRRQGRLVVVHSSRGGAEHAATVVETRDALAELERRLGSEGLEVTVRDFVRGNEPAEDVIEVAEKEDAALIVIGLRRRSPVGKLLMGSNAQDILLRADCPVLAVKAT
ncbi:universal stress protein [Blastococcus sp. CT_GayMR20]|uniref:universal stress protein n=1 Tax=Blastococcus sp. CT_GayMR20 TaxID=2559609 RepID=UPI0010745FB7|nr:universal stress protein [Blastococcus sp. CT_GayMR20]TFV75043.1 universal stress protein [Blastococcus sp. CT_GayMR20]